MTAPGTGNCLSPINVATTLRALALQQGHCITSNLAADGGLGGHVPTGPGCISLAGRPGARRAYSSPVTNSPQDCLCTGSASYPVFVHRPAISTWTCLPHPASRRRTCPLANLRLCEYLVSGLSPDWIRAMHGTHVALSGARLRASAGAASWMCTLSLLQSRSKPLALNAGATTGDVRNRTKALAASGSLDAALTPIENLT